LNEGGDVARKIPWNDEALAQGADELEPEDVTCPDCESTPKLRQFGRLSCECGKIEGAVTD
jgi:hypothetical protein